MFEDLKNNVPRCLTSKYTNTNTQIQFGPKSSTTTSSSSSNYKSKFPNFAQNNFCFFDLIFTIICFRTLSKKFFWKKLKNVNVTSHHQAIINNNIIIRSWNSEQSNAQKPNFWRRTFAHFHNSFGVGRKPIGESPKKFWPLRPRLEIPKKGMFFRF